MKADHIGKIQLDIQKKLLFPSWPVRVWDVAFKLRAPGNTTIEAACVGGRLARLEVTPPERRGAVRVLNCAE